MGSVSLSFKSSSTEEHSHPMLIDGAVFVTHGDEDRQPTNSKEAHSYPRLQQCI